MNDQTPPAYSRITSIRGQLALVFMILAALSVAVLVEPLVHRHGPFAMTLHLILTVAGVLAAMLLITAIARRMVQPIRELTVLAQRIQKGDLDVDIPVASGSEIGILSASLKRTVEQLRISTAEIRQIANHDLITGLPNRYRLQTLLERQVGIRDANGATAHGSVFFIDILDLRRVSDHLGHPWADKVLTNIAHCLIDASPCKSPEENLRNAAGNDASKPVLARFGGSELVLAVPGLSDPQAAMALAERLHAAVAGMDRQRQFRPRIAIGIARYPDDSNAALTVKHYAAIACTATRPLGGENRTASFRPEMLEAIKARETIEHYLRAAIVESGFEVYYQPKISTSDWAVAGAEALVRLNHPQRGVVGPGEFIPVAELSGLIGEIGMIVLDQAIAQCAAWFTAGEPTEVSINVSIEQLRAPEFAEMVIARLGAHGCPARLVTIEITETLATTDVAGVASQIATLRAAGVRIAIDDFGTGYSNLVQLIGMKFDILKIDRSFVAGIETDGNTREVARTIIQLGKTLGCRVVMEGTETPAQVAAAVQLGCDEIQGFYFSRPLKREDFDSWRAQRTLNPVHARQQDLELSSMGRPAPALAI
ncbi:putative bifunctional diguanylate cyclase/phosphodiesterase [Hoeflea olei]|uniref:Diguanylate cyclase n=1 Tax=Hoeflea olei TaxID=1480615 RepID=A0A1C1YUR5_9HYPH|nr:GGDEF domain-containing phosphodiesterase [Hoeflea olei]OCW57244.1 hypothetical protein AWJ14_13090 [Hoeflea olei]